MNIIDVVKMKLYDPEVIRRERMEEAEVPTSNYLYGFNDGYTQGWRDGRAALKEKSKTRLIDTDEVIKAIDHHTFDTEQPKKGKWIYGEDEYGKDGYRCDKCGFFIPWDYIHKFINYIDDHNYRPDNYCPNCGSDNRGEQDE